MMMIKKRPSHNEHFVDFSDFKSINNSIITLKSIKCFSLTVLLSLFSRIARHAFTPIRVISSA